MNCAGCDKKATHLVEVAPGQYQEHCLEHMLEALCSVPVSVIDLEAWEEKQHANKLPHTA